MSKTERAQIVAADALPDSSDVAPSQVMVAEPLRRDRWSAVNNYGSLRPETVDAILRDADLGRPERWIDLCSFVLERDPHISAVYETRMRLPSSVPWVIEPGKTSDVTAQTYADAAADFCRIQIEGLPNFEQFVRLALDAVGKGFSVHEKMYARRDGAWWVTDLRWRDQRRFVYDEDWKLRLYDAGNYSWPGLPLDPTKFVVHQPQAMATTPVKSGILRRVVWVYVFKRWVTAWWASANERFGAPIPIVKVPENTKANVRQSILAMLEQVSQGQGAVLDVSNELEALKTDGYTGAQFKDFLAWCDEQTSKAILGTGMATDIGANGSRAQAQVGADANLLPRAEGDAQDLATTIERQLFGDILAFNTHLFGGRMPPIPRIRWQFRSEEDPKADELLVKAGAVTINELRASAKYPPIAGGERIATIDVAPQYPSAGGAPADVPLAPAAPPKAPSSFSRSPTKHEPKSPFERALLGLSGNRSR